MAFSIGPKFNNAVDANNLARIYLEGDKTIDERNRNDWDQALTGIKALGSGVGKARQWVAAEDLKKQLMDKLASLQSARDAANEELIGLNQMRDEAKGTVVGINDMLLNAEVAPNYPFRNDLDNDPATYYPFANFPKKSYLSVMGKKAGL